MLFFPLCAHTDKHALVLSKTISTRGLCRAFTNACLYGMFNLAYKKEAEAMRTDTAKEWARALACGELDGELSRLRPGEANLREPYLLALETFQRSFGADRPLSFVSAPGRTELGGNHTDHQHGRVLAAAVSLDMVAAVAPNGENRVRVRSLGMPDVEVDLSDLTPHKEEENTSAALVRGMAAGLAPFGQKAGGFDAAVVSSIPVGAGLSSSAAYEILMGEIQNALWCGGALLPTQIARAGHLSENVYFNKPCGMMDQMACAVGGVVAIDFNDPAEPQIERIALDPQAYGYRLFLTSAGGSHADLTDEYAAIPREMRAVARLLGVDVLRRADERALYENLPLIRREAGDRAVLRAMHFFDENRRAQEEAEALQKGDLPRFASLMRASGASSEALLQNIYPANSATERGVALALALSARLLEGTGGAWRVHGGGFAGTVQALVPEHAAKDYQHTMNRLLNDDAACRGVAIRPVGGYVLGGILA